MKTSRNKGAKLSKAVEQPLMRPIAKSVLFAGFISTVLATTNTVFAQTESNSPSQNVELEEILVTGIRQSLETALQEKRASDNLVEVIIAEDIGKLPDQKTAQRSMVWPL